jgi:hypothetical protein
MAGVTPRYSKANNQEQEERRLNTLVAQLTREGWEPIGKGERWWNYKFRRRVK